MNFEELWDFVPTVRSIIAAATVADRSGRQSEDSLTLISLVQQLSDQQRIMLLALMWSGRGDMTYSEGISYAKNGDYGVGYITGKSPLAEYLEKGLDASGIYHYDHLASDLVNNKLRELVAKMLSDGFISDETVPALETRLGSIFYEYIQDATICKGAGCGGRNQLIRNDLMGATGWRVWKCDKCGGEYGNRAAPEDHNWLPTLPSGES